MNNLPTRPNPEPDVVDLVATLRASVEAAKARRADAEKARAIEPIDYIGRAVQAFDNEATARAQRSRNVF